MFEDLLEESWVYQETLEKGRKQGMEQVILRFVELHFPSLLVQAKQVLEREMSLEQLQALNDKLYMANTIEKVTTALQAYETDQ